MLRLSLELVALLSPSIKARLNMNNLKYPNFISNENLLKVNLRESLHPNLNKIPHRFVCDFDESGSLIGIEILDLKRTAGENVMEGLKEILTPMGDAMQYTYDPEVDAFYFKIQPGRSRNQKAVNGKIITNDKGCLVALEVCIGTSEKN
jgi:uncharacterized protein YuzE